MNECRSAGKRCFSFLIQDVQIFGAMRGKFRGSLKCIAFAFEQRREKGKFVKCALTHHIRTKEKAAELTNLE